jgi:Ca-activated chloride channel family protein
MSSAADNHYLILGVPRDASQTEIQRAYHKKARTLHPDVSDSDQAQTRFLQLQKAYDVLSQPDQRDAYDKTLPAQADNQVVGLTAQFSRSLLARIPEPQLIYALIELKALAVPKQAASPPLNVCLILDRSTSMQGLRMDTLKTTARKLIRQFRKQDVLSIVTFSDRAEVVIPAARNQDLEKAEARISLLQAGGGTEIYNGLKEGYFEVTRNLSPNQINQIILITDGRTYGDEQACLELADQARRQGVAISGMGIGTEWNDEFLDQLGSRTGGSAVFVANDKDIQKFLEDKFNRLEQIYAENLELSFIKEPDIELKYAFRLEPEPGPLDVRDALRLGSIPRDGSLSFLLEFLVSSVPSEVDRVNLLRGELKLNIPSLEIPSHELAISLTRPTSSTIDPEPPPQRIVKAMSRLTLYRMQEQARNDLAEGKVEEATRKLQNLATHLLAQGEHQLARTVLGEAQRVNVNTNLTQQGEKRIKYGTRALLLPPNLEDMLA